MIKFALLGVGRIGKIHAANIALNPKCTIECIYDINKNAANEYYLTDLVEILSAKGVKINCIQANPREVMGANNKKELHELESILRQMNADKLLDQGISLIDASLSCPACL